MKITQNKIDELNIELTLEIAGEDYAAKKKHRQNDFRRKAEIKGFRKGMVPMGLIEKMYGQSALVDAVNDVIADSLNGFIKDNDLKVIGEPLPAENQPATEWKDGNDFTFKFDIALSPKIDFELDKKDEVPYYTINITDAAKEEMKNNLLRQYGSLEEGGAAKEEDFMIVDFEQGETKVEGTYIALRNVSDAVRPSFVGLKAGDTVDVNVNEAFTNETDRASMLKVKKEELASLDPVFKMTVKNVKTFVSAPMTQETFDKVFGEGNVKSAEEFVSLEDKTVGEGRLILVDADPQSDSDRLSVASQSTGPFVTLDGYGDIIRRAFYINPDGMLYFPMELVDVYHRIGKKTPSSAGWR